MECMQPQLQYICAVVGKKPFPGSFSAFPHYGTPEASRMQFVIYILSSERSHWGVALQYLPG